MEPILLDCTLRDGGYYNSWHFGFGFAERYLEAMASIKADYVELGFRTISPEGFRGAFAYTTDKLIESLNVPDQINLGVMMNGSDLVNHPDGPIGAVNSQFTKKSDSRVSLVRIACHFHEFEAALQASGYLKELGYLVGFNLMQIAGKTSQEVVNAARLASNWPLDVLYFADSMGGMSPEDVVRVVDELREGWSGDIGIHTHDNMGAALANSLAAVEHGVKWIDGTVLGMGRGPGNVKTEYLAIELEAVRNKEPSLSPLFSFIRNEMKPQQDKYGWGTNPFYFLAGKYDIHPTYVQEMLNDARFSDEDILATIDNLHLYGGQKFSRANMDRSRNFYDTPPKGSCDPAEVFCNRDVLILGTGPGTRAHASAIERFIEAKQPLVLALNTQTEIATDLIDYRAACHPVRLLADIEQYQELKQPLFTPYSMLPEEVRTKLDDMQVFDFGLKVVPDEFEFGIDWVTVPNTLVVSYSLAIATAGKARQIFLAGFDGFVPGDPRNEEITELLDLYSKSKGALPLCALTPTAYPVKSMSIYALSD